MKQTLFPGKKRSLQMELSELYERGEKAIRQKEFGFLLDGVETQYILKHDRAIIDGYTFSPRYIDAVESESSCTVLGIDFETPVIMSSMTMPIPAIMNDGLMETALGLKASGSLMWTGTPVPGNLAEIVKTGVPIAANVKPFKDREKMFRAFEDVQETGVQWIGVEIDSGQGTKVKDRLMASDCSPLSVQELVDIRKRISRPLIFKGILSPADALKSIDAGADAIVVSNHGGHTLDYLPHPFQVMDGIVKAVGGKIPIFVDGGFRRGSDVLKGLAFGATLIGLGRPVLYGLAAGGRDGVQAVIGEITAELKRILCMVGSANPSQVKRNILIAG